MSHKPNIKTISEFKELENFTENEIFFVDLEGVVLQPNMYYELLIDKYFFNLFLRVIEINNIIPCKISDCIYLGKNFIRYLTDISIPEVFNKLRRNNAKIFALSSGFPSIQKKDQIKKLKVNFNGFLFTKRSNKGQFLVNFFNSHENFIGKNICVIDNHIHKLNDIYETYKEHFPEYVDQLQLILYKNDFISDININKFTSYWKQVVQNILHGKINEIKNRINSIKLQIERNKNRKISDNNDSED